ncbi:MAG: hypothetical protein ACJ0OY_01065 [Dehalococcoidia bacterium]|tara:strand:- start:794 stop:955 length:162 start_codon:yes stop_codon:yes gene_type:complete
MKKNKKLNDKHTDKKVNEISTQNEISTPVPEENKTEYGKLGRPTKYKWDGPEG